MDKIGPIARDAEDCAIVFEAIRGADVRDAAAVDAPFHYAPRTSLKGLRIGVLDKDFRGDYPARANDAAALARLRELGADLVTVRLPDYPAEALSFILSAEAGAAFSDLTLSGRDATMVRQVRDAWPNVFRASRFIPAVEYVQANRVRHELIQAMARLMNGVDLYAAPSVEGDNLLVTNLTGHPCVVVPTGFDEKGMPTTISFTGRLYDEATVLAVAKAWQDATGFHLKHPPKFQ
jgi:Asp-tRNA(Asn)/Glu-tRNA(Gln) amidotransferase A subunit family amidase